jgi:hypothetical protein
MLQGVPGASLALFDVSGAFAVNDERTIIEKSRDCDPNYIAHLAMRDVNFADVANTFNLFVACYCFKPKDIP